MSVVLASAAAGVYAAAMIGFHRWNVRRLRRVAGLACLARLDWGALWQGLPPGDGLLLDLQMSGRVEDLGRRAAAAGYTPAEQGWLEVVARSRTEPRRALQALEERPAASAAEAYLREHLRLVHATNALNLEVAAFTAKRRLARAIARFGDVPALYFVRALASASVGMNRAALDDLGRAVYYSRQAPFYVSAVLETPWIAEVRPALVYQCRQAIAPPGG